MWYWSFHHFAFKTHLNCSLEDEDKEEKSSGKEVITCKIAYQESIPLFLKHNRFKMCGLQLQEFSSQNAAWEILGVKSIYLKVIKFEKCWSIQKTRSPQYSIIICCTVEVVAGRSKATSFQLVLSMCCLEFWDIHTKARIKLVHTVSGKILIPFALSSDCSESTAGAISWCFKDVLAKDRFTWRIHY